jgi:hypothetical protein
MDLLFVLLVIDLLFGKSAERQIDTDSSKWSRDTHPGEWDHVFEVRHSLLAKSKAITVTGLGGL